MRNCLLVVDLLVILIVCVCFTTSKPTVTSPLLEYVNAPDPTFAWNVSSVTFDGPGYTVYNIFMTSQSWLTPQDSSVPVWTHWLEVCIPWTAPANTTMAFMYITGDSNSPFNQPPTSSDVIVDIICGLTQTIVAALHEIPNQPIVFAADPLQKKRYEDAVIAYTWAHWLNNTKDYNWLARFPMTKAAINALTAIQQFTLKTQGIDIPKFVVGGASKRGWTTWMVGAVGDPRVIAIIPIVAPIANIVPQFAEQYQSYGNFTFAVSDYVDSGIIPGWLFTPNMKDLLYWIDPIQYQDALAKIPKYVIVSSQDEFFMPDAAQYYWNQIPGEKHLWIVQNADHSLGQQILDVAFSLGEYYLNQFDGQTNLRPVYYWNISADGTKVRFVDTSQKGNIINGKVWYSNNPIRDWRMYNCDSVKCKTNSTFLSQTLQAVSPGIYEITMSAPSSGYTAFYIEVEYQLLEVLGSFRVSTDMSIIPKTFPYAPCSPSVCACGWNCKGNK